MSEQQRVPVGVRFKEAGKVYYFDARGFDVQIGQYVVVETSHGQEAGRVVISPEQVVASEIKETLKPIVRIAEPADIDRAKQQREKARERAREAQDAADELNLNMRVAGAEYDLPGKQLTLYFTAPERVDFRELVKKLSQRFGLRVQLLQVGERDRAKLADGIGRCGERLCCASWMTSFPTVSIRMAKDQELPLNPSKISGVCGRLLCCLTYEHEMYRELRGQLPKVGAMVSTPAGDARVSQINILKQTVVLTMQEGATLEVPVVDMQLQFGVTVRPAELVEMLERPLQEAEERAAAAVAGPPAEAPEKEASERKGRRRRGGRRGASGELRKPQPVAAPSGPAAAAGTPEGQKARRRRGRRGGRRRRGSGGSSQETKGQ